jgi:histidine phosphotransferase ChpT
MPDPIMLDALDLAALLCSRVCHDLISPTGAILNGLEVFEEEGDAETKAFAISLIKKSASTASARLQFCRIAFGAAGGAGAQVDLGDAESMARGFMEDEKTRIVWTLPRMLLAKNRVKLLLNMLVVATQTIPRGGTLTVDSVGTGETVGFRITATGTSARIPPAVQALLDGTPESGTVDAHVVQPFYTGLLARACGLGVGLEAQGEAIVVSTRQSTGG